MRSTGRSRESICMDDDDPSLKRRSNGFQQPFHPLQIVSWVVFGLDAILFSTVCVPLVQAVLLQAVLALSYLTGTLVLVWSTAKATACDAADTMIFSTPIDLAEDELDID